MRGKGRGILMALFAMAILGSGWVSAQEESPRESLGLDEVWAKHGNTTGFILLVDGESREVLSKLTHEQKLKELGASLLEAVEQAS